MSSLSQFRSLRLSNIAEALARLLGEAEIGELTYLQFAEQPERVNLIWTVTS